MGVATISLAFSILSVVCVLSSTATDCGITVILLGSTGDLARRYIWPALFENQLLHSVHTEEGCSDVRLVIFGASRSEVTDREVALASMLVNINCASESCSDSLQAFRDSVRLIKLRAEDDYKDLAQQITLEYSQKNIREVGRMAYLAIPPSAYVPTVGHVATFLRPSNQSWLRVVLEKPFGRDLSSALELSKAVAKYLEESEVYRIDHYLGKAGFQQITKFLSLNVEWLKRFWNRNGIQLIEVAMEEVLDIGGRASFYNANGVIRDVHQNHLTEILAALLMDPSASSRQAEKVRVLAKLFSPRLHHTVLGQYVGYQKHLEEEGIVESSITPTYASSVLFSKDPKWRGVPLILTSGKQMSERKAYVRVVFKTGVFSDWKHPAKCPPEIRFVIQEEGLKPGILLTSHFSRQTLNFDTKLIENIYTEPDSKCTFKYFEQEGNISTNSYISLIDAVLSGRAEYFVDSEGLLESWRIWTPLLDEIQLTQSRPLPYSPSSLEVLEFSVIGSKLIPNSQLKQVDSSQLLSTLSEFSDNSSLHSEWSQHKTVVANKYALSSLLAEELLRHATNSIEAHGSFHLALPGGSSPLLLMDTLSLDYRYSFPWKHTFIWQTDERCVDPRTKHSNFQQISKQLLCNVPLTFQNIYPMPVDLQQGVCVHSDRGSGLYERALSNHTHGGRLDYVLLGTGSDGHIASLFPGATSSNGLVELVEPNRANAHRRMTLTLECVLEAKNIGLIFIGKNKKEIVKTVWKYMRDDSVNEIENFPVLKLMQRATKEQLSVYIESELL